METYQSIRKKTQEEFTLLRTLDPLCRLYHHTVQHPFLKPITESVLFLIALIVPWFLIGFLILEEAHMQTPPPQVSIHTVTPPPLNIERLAHCVAVAETSNCTTGMAVSKNNCHGIMTWVSGKREGKIFTSHQESFQNFKWLWLNRYGNHFPTTADADRYAGKAEGKIWLQNVTKCYS